MTASATTFSGLSERRLSVARSPKMSRSLSAALRRPSPVEVTAPSCSISPGLETWIRSSPPELRAMIAI